MSEKKKSYSIDYIRQLAQNTPPILAYTNADSLGVWQSVARKKLRELLRLPLEYCDDQFTVKQKAVLDGYVRIDFEFQSEPGYMVPCSLLTPLDMDKPLPDVICLQGHSTGMHISMGTPKFPRDSISIAGGRDFAIRAVKEGFCAIALEQRYMGVCGQNEEGTPSCASDNTAMAALLMGRTAIGERVWDIQRLIDVIEKHLTEYIKPERIICMGNSGGGTATFYASCLDERIYLSMPSCAVCTYEDSIMAMYHCPCNFVPDIRRYFNMGDLGCLIAPRRLVVVCGVEDQIFPIRGVKASYKIIQEAYKAAGKEHLCHLIKGDGGHQFYPDEAWPIAKGLLEYGGCHI